ncbi:hypothetical protein Tco_0561766 [Tanacetum coccineum]
MHSPKATIKFRILQGQDDADVSSGEWSADQCDAFNSYVDEAPTAHTMFMENLLSADPIYDEGGPSYDSDILSETTSFKLINVMLLILMLMRLLLCMLMANLSSADPIYDEAGPSYDLDILSEVQDHDNYLDSVGEYHEDNAVQVVLSNVSFVPNDALMMIINDIHEQAAQCVSANEQNKVGNESLTVELVALYNGHEIVKTNHAPAVVHDSEDTLELAEITRKRMIKKLKIPLCVEKKVKIAPPD